MRPHIPTSGSFFHLAAGHLNVVLPSVLPPMPVPRLFWHRARSVRSQASAAARSRLSRAQFLGSARDRVARAQHWARVDDEEVANPGLGLGIRVPERELPQPLGSPPQGPPPSPQGTPLLEASVLGNLDGMYRHDVYPGIRMFSLTAGSRQPPGGLLLSAYILRGKLVLSLGYDRNGFQGGAIERWWGDVLALVDEVLLA